MQRCAALEARIIRPTQWRRNLYGGRLGNQDAHLPTVQRLEQGLDDGRGHALKIDAASKTVATAAGSLPLSPLMDPSFVDRRSKFRAGKAPSMKESDPKMPKWRKILRASPYAQALATPVRTCNVTGVTMPRYFFDDWTLVAGPDGKTPWWVPRELAKELASPPKPLKTSAQPQGFNEDIVEAEGEAITSKHSSAAVETTATKDGPPAAVPQSPVRSYFLSRKRLLEIIKPSTQSKAMKIPPLISKFRLRHLSHVSVWRDDMDDFFLDIQRQRIVAELLRFAELEKYGYLIGCAQWGDVDALRHKRGCLLWQAPLEDQRDILDRRTHMPSEAVEAGQPQTGPLTGEERPVEGQPGEFATLDLDGVKYGMKIPVHNLNYLLGEECLQQLRDKAPIFRDCSLVMLAQRQTVPLQLRMWKLQGYLPRYGEPDTFED